MNNGEVLSFITRIGKKKVTPFKKWEGCPKLKDWEFEIELLNVGQNIDVSNVIGNSPMGSMPWLVKVEVLARCITKINGDPFVTQEQLNAYNKEHNLEGDHAVSLLEYKKILIKKWDQVVVNKLEEAYNDLDKEHQNRLLGGALNPENLREEEKKKAEEVIQKIKKETQGVEIKKEEKVTKESAQSESSLNVIASIKSDDNEKKSEQK